MDCFKDISTAEVVHSIRERGFYFSDSFLTENYVDQLLKEVDFDYVSINHNNIGVVASGNQKFLSHCLAKSKAAYDLVTHSKVLEICNAYFTERYQLTNHRFSQTLGKFYMPWHTDNNLQVDKTYAGKHSMSGLLFLVYLTGDQNRGSFQYIKGSHHWSQKHDDEVYLSDRWVKANHKDEIVNFDMPKGSLLVFDIHGIHRAPPACDRHHISNFLLFQIDQVGDRAVGHGEQNLINAGFIDNPSPELFSYLGFGKKREYPPFPNTSVATLPVRELLSLQTRLLPLAFKAVAENFVKSLLPGEMMVEVKRAVWAWKRSRQ